MVVALDDARFQFCLGKIAGSFLDHQVFFGQLEMHGSRLFLIRCFSGKTPHFQPGKGVFCADKPTDLNGILKDGEA